MSSTIAPLSSYRSSSSALDRPNWRLAIGFQEAFTAIVRLRYNRQAVSSADSFRAQMKQALAMAEHEATTRACNPGDIQLAKFAVVAFLDESVLSCKNPVFSDWARRPLQAELYSHQLAGEVFFKELQKILQRSDSSQTADLLEVYCLCLLLGFKGQYASEGELRSLTRQAEDKIRRVRGAPELSPRGGIPSDAIRLERKDNWSRPLMVVTASSVLLAVVLFVVFKLLLSSGAAEISTLLGQLVAN
jgi:type VI secretion system protein ImpK